MHWVRNTVFANDVLVHNILKGGEYNVVIVQWNNTGANLTFDHNVFYGPDTPVWVLNNQWREG